MLIIIDARLPDSVYEYLESFGEVFLLESSGIVYDSISGHPDVFLTQMGNLVIVAPNAPKALIEVLKKHRIPFLRGKEKLGEKFPETSLYNAVCNSRYILHKKNHTSACVLRQIGNREFISVPQAYTRCNLLALTDGSFITSDPGIYSSLSQSNLEVHFFDSKDIILNGEKYGFLGGAMGIMDNEIFIIGHLDQFNYGQELKALLDLKGMKTHELYNGPLIDGGGILFLE